MVPPLNGAGRFYILVRASRVSQRSQGFPRNTTASLAVDPACPEVDRRELVEGHRFWQFCLHFAAVVDDAFIPILVQNTVT